MLYDGGMCVGCVEALEWVRDLEGFDTEMRDRVWRRMAYEFDKGIPVKPTYRKGVYGRKYDQYTCGRCGFVLHLPIDKYCSNCGQKVTTKDYRSGKDWHHYEQVAREKYEQLTFDFCKEESDG